MKVSYKGWRRIFGCTDPSDRVIRGRVAHCEFIHNSYTGRPEVLFTVQVSHEFVEVGRSYEWAFFPDTLQLLGELFQDETTTLPLASALTRVFGFDIKSPGDLRMQAVGQEFVAALAQEINEADGSVVWSIQAIDPLSEANQLIDSGALPPFAAEKDKTMGFAVKKNTSKELPSAALPRGAYFTGVLFEGNSLRSSEESGPQLYLRSNDVLINAVTAEQVPIKNSLSVKTYIPVDVEFKITE